MSIRTRTFRNTLYSIAGTYTEYVLGMLASILIARHLGPEGLGAYSVAIWLVAMGVSTTNSGTASTMIRFVAELRGGGGYEHLPAMVAWARHAQRWCLLGVLVLAMLVMAVAGERVAPGIDHRLLMAFLAVAIAIRASYMLNIGIAKGFEDFGIVARVAMIGAPVNLVMVLVACWLGASVESLLVVFVASGAVFLAVSARLVAPLHRGSVDTALAPVFIARVRRHIWLSSATVTASFMAASEMEVLFLSMYVSQDAAGHFKVAYQLAVGMAALAPGVFSALLLPMMASASARGGELPGRRFASTTAYLSMLSAVLVAFAVVLPGPAIRVMFGEAYLDAVPVFSLCLVATALTAASAGASSLLISSDRQGTILALVLASCALKVVLDVVLISHMGLIGAAWAFVVTAIAVVVAMLWLAVRQTRVTPDWTRIGRIGLAAAIAALAALPAARGLPPLPGLLVGGAVLASVYGAGTLLLGCWTRGDVEHMQHLHRRLVSGRPGVGDRLLAWAWRRAPEEASI